MSYTFKKILLVDERMDYFQIMIKEKKDLKTIGKIVYY